MQKKLHSEYVLAIGASILFGLLFWIIDGSFEYLFFHKNLKFLLLEGPENLIESLFTKVPLHSVFVRISFIGSSVLGGVIVAVFLHRRNRLQRVLRESEERYRDLYENALVGLSRTRVNDGKVLESNKRMASIFGYSDKDEFVNEFIFSEHYVDRNARHQFIRDVEKTGSVTDRIVQFYRKDGKAIWIKFNARIFKELGYLENVAIDITEQKTAEEEHAGLQQKLQQSQKMEAIGTLAGGIAHDFNNILSPIIGYAELLKDDLSQDHLRGHVDEIIHAALRAKDLVKQILSFSRQTEHETMPMQLQPVVKEALKLLRSSIPTTINIEQDIDKRCGVVIADPTQIHQIVMNLATNAYHAMEELSGGRLAVTLKQVRMEPDSSVFPDMTPGDYALLTVSDTGEGMEKHVLDNVFDPYFTTKKSGKGTGLGLSVVHGIVKNYQGDIRIFSEPGRGTEVFVYFPVIMRRAEQKEVKESQPVVGGSERILLVDDEAPIIRMEQQMLERLGYRIAIRTGSLEALEAFKANPDGFDLIITDMNMPNMSGVEFSREIRKIRPDIPIILCTGFSDQINEDNCKPMGIQGYVMKPMIRREIAEAVRKVLDSSDKP